MDNPAFEQVEKLFHDALAVPAAARSAFLDAVCRGNAELRAAVDNLLRHAEAEGDSDDFLTSPLSDTAAMLRQPSTLSGPPPQGARGSDRDRPSIPGYEALEELGRGGMGRVWKARQISLNRIVALKMLLPHGAPTAEMLARFRTEAEALARLQHPNIVTIYDIGEHDGRPYFTMEYIAGPSLAAVLHDTSLAPAASAQLIEVLAHAMYAVHQEGIIHRDLKPANILLQESATDEHRWTQIGEEKDTESGTNSSSSISVHLGSSVANCIPKISDFGLAKDQGASSQLTQTGIIMGTPSYMAPEQARRTAGGVGPAVDVYALGAILYRMLTGRPPFEGDSAMATLAQVINEEPIPPGRLRRGLPRDLVTICLKCLEKSPRARYGSALELAEDLRRFQAGKPIRARPVGLVGRTVRWCRRRPLVAGLLALSTLLAIGLVATVAAYDVRLSEELARIEAIAEERRQQIVQLQVTVGIAAMNDGDTFAAMLRFTEALRLEEDFPDRQPEHRTRVADALRQCPQLLQVQTHDGEVLCTQPTPEGGWLAVVSPDRQVRVRAMLTGEPQGPGLALDHVPLGGAISPDGRSLATITPRGTALVWDVGTGKSRELPQHESQAIRRVAFHPEGRVLLTVDADGTIRRWELTATAVVLPSLAGAGMTLTAFSDDARWLLTLDAAREIRIWDTASGKEVARGPSLGQAVSLAAIGAEGRQIALLGSDNVLRLWDVKTARWHGHPIHPGQGVRQVVFSANAERVATIGGDRAVQVWQVESCDRVCAARRHDDTIAQGCFSPDSRRVVTTNDAGAVQVWDAATGRSLTPPLPHCGARVAAAFCARGNRVVVVGSSGTVSAWDFLTADPAAETVHTTPIDELVARAQVLACGRINDRQQREPLDRDALQAAWDGLPHPSAPR
jgi:serine/threonine protein kinase